MYQIGFLLSSSMRSSKNTLTGIWIATPLKCTPAVEVTAYAFVCFLRGWIWNSLVTCLWLSLHCQAGTTTRSSGLWRDPWRLRFWTNWVTIVTMARPLTWWRCQKSTGKDQSKTQQCKKNGWGIVRFIDHHSLFVKGASDGPHYLVNGTIYIRITRGKWTMVIILHVLLLMTSQEHTA